MIEAIYCLSRPERQERRDNLVPQVERAFSLNLLPRLEINWWSDPVRSEVFVPPSWNSMPGYYAATVAHYRILEDAWRKNFSEILILEDDAQFEEYFYSDFAGFMQNIRVHQPDWLMLTLGFDFRRPPTPKKTNIVLNNGSFQSHAYIINRHGIWRTLDHLWVRHHLVVDVAYADMMNQDKCVYAPDRTMIGLAPFGSDNYTCLQNKQKK